MTEPDAPLAPVPPGTAIRRHRLSTRLWHWTNALCIFILIGSGLMIFNAHPQLYWGHYGANFDQPWFRGAWVWGGNGRSPGWLTIPSGYDLALARRWHLFFALVFAFALLAFMVAGLVNRHFTRDLRFRRAELAPAHIWHDIREHLAFRFHDPLRPAAFNVLQKASYVLALFVLLPLVIFTGLAMSPGMNAAWPWLVELFGGRQSARSLHFIAMLGITGFVIVHLVLVILAGAWNEVRSMVTGVWVVPADEPPALAPEPAE